MGKRSLGRRTVRVLARGIQLDADRLKGRPPVRDAVARLPLLGRHGYDGPVLVAGGGGKDGSCTPHALAACLNAGDWTSVPLPMAGKYSPGANVSVATSDTVVSGSGKRMNPCVRMHRANASAVRNSAAVGSGGPCKCRPAGCSCAQAFWAARNAGKAGSGSAAFEPGSGKLGTPFARMQSAYFTACVSADAAPLRLEEEPHAATAIAQTASTTRRHAGGLTPSTVRGGA
jgi:hypothetical protein